MNLISLFTQAYQLQSEDQLPQAICLYEKILSQDPQHKESLHFLGLAYAQSGKIEKAISTLLQALNVQPDSPSVLNNLANAYKKNHQYEEAITYYLKALEIQPEYAQAHNNIATLYALQNDYSKALRHYSQAVHAAPDFSAAHFNLGLLLFQNSRFKEAKTQFNNVIVLNPDHPQAPFYLGLLYLEENALLEAEGYFQQVLNQADEQQGSALINLGVIALKQEQNQLAVDYFSRALVLDEKDLDARNNLASTFMHHDRFENALMHYDLLLQANPDNLEYLYNSGVAQMALGHLPEALVYFEKVLQLQKAHGPALNNMAAIYLKMDQRETARDYLQLALDCNPQDTISSHMLNALTGAKKSPTNPEYAKNLFNNYALYYDQHLQGALKYSIPQHLGRLLHQLPIIQVNNTLDLGCGTGLSGIVLREISKQLTGVDLAEKMLAQAKEKSIYDHLILSELNDFLQQNTQTFELIVAADVFPYFGSLDDLFKAIHEHLTPGGTFLFTHEISKTPPWLLEPSARFSHHPDYIQQLAEQYDLETVKQEKIPARMQNAQIMEVLLHALKKN